MRRCGLEHPFGEPFSELRDFNSKHCGGSDRGGVLLTYMSQTVPSRSGWQRERRRPPVSDKAESFVAFITIDAAKRRRRDMFIE